MDLKISHAKWRPPFLGVNVLLHCVNRRLKLFSHVLFTPVFCSLKVTSWQLPNQMHPFAIFIFSQLTNQHLSLRYRCYFILVRWCHSLATGTIPLINWGPGKRDAILKTFSNAFSIKISLKLFPNGPINKIPALVQIMAWRRTGNKPLFEPVKI